ncbi:flavodoxin domain-containing protein [Spirillospora albida]|uniref:flavodoxin domain-containing protein n=1 Tax=Spirillospora albida TaxID=58123 RepID=UPI00056403F0|nr:flavodoxin domain-containing protein [Spirillospora albida]
MMIRVLVAYGSERGGTAEIAEWIGAALIESGLDPDVRPAGSVMALDGYDAVVLGGALYAARWHRDARRFVRRFAGGLASRPLWLFSSGPLDATAGEGDLEPVRGVAKAARKAGARGHATFGGRLAPDAEGFLASAVAKKSSGDYRDREQVRAWAAGIGGELRRAAGRVRRH